MATRGERLPRPAGWRNALVLGFLMMVLGNGGVVWAEQYVPSGLAAVVVASSPFWMAGVEAFRADGERMTWRTAAGFVLGFLGIVLLVWPELWTRRGGRPRLRARHDRAADRLSGLVGRIVVFEAARPPRERVQRNGRADARGWRDDAGASARCAANGDRSRSRRVSALAFGYLSTVGAIGGFVAYTYALRHLPVSLVSLYAYINPVIAVALGVAVLGEPFTSRMALAAALVLAGVAIVRAPRESRRRARTSSL